jgi:hypothetical protein
MKFKDYFVFCLLVLGLSGCICLKSDDVVKQTDSISPDMDKAANAIGLSITSLVYYGHKNRWPCSIDDLKLFCLENHEECLLFGWNKIANIKFETLPDESLRLEFYILEDPNESLDNQKNNIVLTLQKPDIQK